MAVRISPPRVEPEPTGASKPPMTAPESDAFRQTGFVLGDEVGAVLDGLRLEGAIAAASVGAKLRGQVAPALPLWSRSWLARQQALHAVQWGSYTSVVPLVRAAADYQAAMLGLLGRDRGEWDAWLAAGPVSIAPDIHGTAVLPHAYRSAETLASHPQLGAVYRVTTELSMPHFQASLFLVASESDAERVHTTFGERAFHLGLAELVLGWLVALGDAQLAAVEGPPFAPPEAGSAAALRARFGEISARDDRCVVEERDWHGERRMLVHNWRRTPGAAAKKLLL